jgi:exopolyphosphatase/guanosine-5'-triphosphate,3'-diphosphate pyrophosphatase
MRRTTIDIGTNTILMLIAELDPVNHDLRTILDIQRLPRLGKGVDADRNIIPESVAKAIEILNEYKQISSRYDSDRITVTATSFIRDAHNRNEFIDAVKKGTGLDIEILSGDDEAKWTFIGGIFDKLTDNGSKFTTIDIGGGSTEITTSTIRQSAIDNNTINNIPPLGRSLNIGSVRINEKFLNSHPPAFESIVLAEDFINEHLKEIDFDITNSMLIGVAGTVTTLGTIKLGHSSFYADKVDNLIINIDEIEDILRRLAVMSLEELYMMGDYMTGRADIVIPGILILKCFMRKFGFEKVKVSTKGLRYGVFLRESIIH